MIIFSFPAGNSRRRRRLKRSGALRRSLQGLGGGSHQQARPGIYRGIACCCYALNPIFHPCISGDQKSLRLKLVDSWQNIRRNR